MSQTIHSAFISVFYKEGLDIIVRTLHQQKVKIYSTGGTQAFIEQLGIPCTSAEDVTGYPSILGGRVKTLHPKIFGGILARRGFDNDQAHVLAYDIPLFDLVIVDLYPFEETIKETNDEATIIEKIDIGGVSLIRAAAKNFEDVLVIASRKQYSDLFSMLVQNNGATTREQRKQFAAAAFTECANYDIAIANYYNSDSNDSKFFQISVNNKHSLRYGENPHQEALFFGDNNELFAKLNGKELSYNNIVDIDAACKIICEFSNPTFAIIKHTNVCGIAEKESVLSAWEAAYAGDPESAFGGVLITNGSVDEEVAIKINELFFEVLIANEYDEKALALLKSKKNRIILVQNNRLPRQKEFKGILNGVLVQQSDDASFDNWNEVGARTSTNEEKEDLGFGNIVCKHLKSNAIAIVKNKQLIGKGCGQTSRVDALRQAIEKANQSGFSTAGAVMASDAFFPFDDCVSLAFKAGITAVIHPGGSIRDEDSIKYCKQHDMAMVITGVRHFRH